MIRREFFRKAIAGAIGLVVPSVVIAKTSQPRWDIVGEAIIRMENGIKKKHRIFMATLGVNNSAAFDKMMNIQKTFDIYNLNVYQNKDI